MIFKPAKWLSFVIGCLPMVGCSSDSNTPAASVGGGAATGGAGTTAATGGGTSTGTTGGTTSAVGGSNGTGCTGSLEQKNSSGLCVAKMVSVTASTNFQIDATEVTQGQYAAWLATNPALPPASDPSCGWKSDAAAGQTFAVKGLIYDGADAEHHPVFQVDWCDAFYYCKGVGKRLCGKIGGGTNDFTKFDDETLSQWDRACTSGGANTYPYGSTFQANTCNGVEHGIQQTAVVGSLTSCQSSTAGYAGIYDLSGNAREWEDSCVKGADPTGIEDHCRVRGGDYVAAEAELNCEFSDSTYIYLAGYNAVGIRCCSI